MSVAQEKKVLPPAIHLKIGVVFHYFEIQGSKKLSTAQRSSRMTTLNRMNHPYDIPSDLGGNVFEFTHLFCFNLGIG